MCAIDAYDYPWGFSAEALSASFVIEGTSDPQIHVRVSRAGELKRAEEESIFSAGRATAARPGWVLSRQDDGWTLEVNHAHSAEIVRRVVRLSSDFSRAQVAVVLRVGVRAPYFYFFEHPLDRLLLINYLPAVRGGLFHACGIDDDGTGLLFVGPQEAGKSTLARL